MQDNTRSNLIKFEAKPTEFVIPTKYVQAEIDLIKDRGYEWQGGVE